MARLKGDCPTLATLGRLLIRASISGRGQTGPWSHPPGDELIAQAMSGLPTSTGTKAG
jgi:crotonobetainyl-CoA:carnitine CoA-transferase CaiB-like acyl-CoA transferase